MDKKRTRAVAAIASLMVLAILLAGCGEQTVGTKYVDFAKCLSSKNVKLYGAFTCPHCLNQKKAFGDGVQYINYIECHPQGPNANPQACIDKKIEGFPTWEMQNGEFLVGEQTMETLSQKSECALPVEVTP
jgi:hypothetical protein